MIYSPQALTAPTTIGVSTGFGKPNPAGFIGGILAHISSSSFGLRSVWSGLGLGSVWSGLGIWTRLGLGSVWSGLGSDSARFGFGMICCTYTYTPNSLHPPSEILKRKCNSAVLCVRLSYNAKINLPYFHQMNTLETAINNIIC